MPCPRFCPRARRIAITACACFLAAVLCASCITVSPPPLATQGPVRPTIRHDAVVPPAGVPLVEWPAGGTFVVPVEIDGPNESFFYDVFIDYDPTNSTGNVTPPQLEEATAESVDGGVFTVRFQIPQPDPRFCHTIEFLVAHAFNRTSLHTPDSLGGDIVTWFYTAGGGPNGCPEYDAGAFQNGAFPQDAGEDGLPVVSPSSPL